MIEANHPSLWSGEVAAVDTLRANEFGRIRVVFEIRSDGGLRVYSDDVPGFVLSHPDPHTVIEELSPALETILTEEIGAPVSVQPVGSGSLPWFLRDVRETREYEARRAA